MELVARRLPGVYVDVAPQEPVETLPRMDVAVFVGFAATGPLHLPVLIESVTQFAAVFGADAPLAWDEVRGERVFAYLGPAVRAFFANGGRRCWVTRVARSLTSEALRLGVNPADVTEMVGIATPNVFAIPGVLALVADTGGSPAPEPIRAALAEASCEGSWSDDLRVSVAVQKQTFGVADFGPGSSPASRGIAFRSSIALRSGDLIEWSDGGLTAYAIIEDVQASLDHSGLFAAAATVCAAFEPVAQDSPPTSPPAREGAASVRGFGDLLPATLAAPVDLAGAAALTFQAPIAASLERGHWARWSGDGTTVWLRIDSIERRQAFAGSPMAIGSSWIQTTVSGPAWREVDPELAAAIGTMRHTQRLTLELRVLDGTQAFRLAPVGLTPRHAAAWWNQVNDAQYYGPQQDVGGGPSSPVVTAEARRFPLSRDQEPNPLAWLPLGVEPLFGPGLARLPQHATALERDGLATFTADLFLDPELATVPVQDLAELADSIRFLRDAPRRLLGIHTAFSVGRGGVFNEATLLAVPDAIHLGWERRPEPAVAAAQPPRPPAPVEWRTHRGACASASESTPADGPDFGVFLDCTTRAGSEPVLDGPDAPVPPGVYRLTWSAGEPAGEYVLIEATDVDFADAREIYRGGDTEYVVLNLREGIYYYQVFVDRGDQRSPGSNAVAVRVRGDEWVQTRVAAVDESLERAWLAVHRAALRLAAANGELFVALAMPRHFRTPQALGYAQHLRAVRQPPSEADAEAFGFTETRALSYGALYFPWLQANLGGTPSDLGGTMLSTTQRTPRVVPPDGVAIGILAARASRRGAWVAPANEPMKDVVALFPVIAESEWRAVQDAQINLVRFDPRGLFTLSADTLAFDADIRPINVRRLMILLRRLALRRGVNYVFEPNGPTLRRAVEHSFGELLTDLFQRGAFAGATPAQSFRVVTDDTINTALDADAGRFFVELRIAPSFPMRFLALRLLQQGERLTVMEEL